MDRGIEAAYRNVISEESSSSIVPALNKALRQIGDNFVKKSSADTHSKDGTVTFWLAVPFGLHELESLDKTARKILKRVKGVSRVGGGTIAKDGSQLVYKIPVD